MRLFFVMLMAVAGLSCNQADVKAQSKLDPNAFEAMLAKNQSVQLVDVRTPGEYAGGHLKNARLINYYDADFATQIGKLDKSKPVMVYCAAGSRSADAAKQLGQLGFKTVYDLEGGMRAWRAAGKTVVQ